VFFRSASEVYFTARHGGQRARSGAVMANLASCFVVLAVILAAAIDVLADRWRCEANGYAVQGRAIVKDYGVKFFSFSIGLEPELGKKIVETWGSVDAWRTEFEKIAMTRGIGWAILSYDPETGILQNGWVDEQHLGQLNSTRYIIGIDMWEHSYVADYQPSGKKQYVVDFLDQVSWGNAMERFGGK
jgi:hypothetical protein